VSWENELAGIVGAKRHLVDETHCPVCGEGGLDRCHSEIAIGTVVIRCPTCGWYKVVRP